MQTFADKVIAFNNSLEFNGELPPGIRIMNPFKENEQARIVSAAFYKKYYADTGPRHIILGINPGRFGAGLTGIPFTDPKRLVSNCGLPYEGNMAHEPSSVFIYDMIREFGGEERFYSQFYINSICPLGFTSVKENGKEINYNYYDSADLLNCVYDFIVESTKKQIAFEVNTDLCFCLGTGKNKKIVSELNQRFGFFQKIIFLEHPRYIMQYKSKDKQYYIEKYVKVFENALEGLD